MTIISRSCLIAADTVMIGVTWFTLAQPYAIRHIHVLKSSLASVLLIDGTVYFVMLAVLNALHLAFSLLPLDITVLQSKSVITTFTVPLSATLVSRFLLHIQSASLRAVGSTYSLQFTYMHPANSLIYERVVGSLGASISANDHLNQDGGLSTDDNMMNDAGAE
ncbi:hypothetical protein BD310DRAFT_259673 [Dichomitus squalens]|uniref:Uncharacterized protein n=1 Tax=Dichomitus squalens TaxID=114155 RepID=A0A4Q9PG25_9APHY|nr:hypothetical protein BD310DRAFT_259673 [Dichomitus squalens]